MSQDPAKFSFPFINRDQLAFEQGAKFGLRITSQADTTGTLTIRGMTREGPFVYKHTTNSDYSLQQNTFNLPDIPIFLTVADELDLFFQGSVFVTLSLVVNGDILYQLGSGIVYFPVTMSWPSVNRLDMKPFPARVTTLANAQPAANTEHSYTVPNGIAIKVKALKVQLVGAAQAASRRVHFVFTVSSQEVMDVFSDIDQIISETKNYNVLPVGAIPDSTDNNEIVVPLPAEIHLPAGSKIETRTLNLQTGDRFGQMFIYCERYFETA